MTDELRTFFEAYRSAFNALDGEAVAALYAVPSGIASSGRYTHWASRDPIESNMVALCDLYRQHGFISADFQVAAFIAQGDSFAVADLAWKITWRGKDESRFNTTYNLMRIADRWRVLLCTAYSEERFWDGT